MAVEGLKKSAPASDPQLSHNDENTGDDATDHVRGDKDDKQLISRGDDDDHNNDAEDDIDEDSDEDYALNPVAERLVDQCQNLLDEIDRFRKHANRENEARGRKVKKNSPGSVEMRQYRTTVQQELRNLEALTHRSPDDPKVAHTLRSSNLTFLDAVWAVAKNCRGIEAILKTVHYYIDSKEENSTRIHDEGGQSQQTTRRRKGVARIDIVAQAGVEWIKVSTINQSRLLFEIGKATWGFEADNEDGETESGDDEEKDIKSQLDTATALVGFDDSDDSIGALALVRVAKGLILAASQTRVQYLHPTVTVVLPNITYDAKTSAPPLVDFINRLLATGVRVQTANGFMKLSPPPDLDEVIERLVITPQLLAEHISNPLNVDTTVLLALISDISHQNIKIEPRFHDAVLRQLQVEAEEPLLPTSIYPIFEGRDLVCTTEAYTRFIDITDIVGSENEKRRAALLVTPPLAVKPVKDDPNDIVRDMSPAELHNAFQALSKYALPATLRLPIKIIASQKGELMKSNAIAAAIGPQLSTVNRCVLFTGWALGITTITSNGSIAKRVRGLVDEYRNGSEDTGPQMYVLPMSRSLVGTARKGADIVGE